MKVKTMCLILMVGWGLTFIMALGGLESAEGIPFLIGFCLPYIGTIFLAWRIMRKSKEIERKLQEFEDVEKEILEEGRVKRVIERIKTKEIEIEIGGGS